jgi:hypothetical protein
MAPHPQDQPRGALQRDLTAAALPLGAIDVVVFEEVDQPHRRDPLFPLPLQSDSDDTLQGPTYFALSITWSTLPIPQGLNPNQGDVKRPSILLLAARRQDSARSRERLHLDRARSHAESLYRFTSTIHPATSI